MVTKNKHPKVVDFLQMSDSERVEFLREIKEGLRQRIDEAKILQSFVEAENLTINGQTISFEDSELKGFSFDELLKDN